MCESRAVVVTNGSEQLLLDDVVELRVLDDGSIKLVNIEGREMILRDLSLHRIDFVNHRIYFVKR